MRRPCFSLLLIAALNLAACLGQPPPPTKWTTAFWFWEGSSAAVTAPVEAVDAIYCQVGTIRNAPRFYAALPKHLPPAHEYWLVFRFEERGVPPLAVIPGLVEDVARLSGDARHRGLPIAGIQLDIDTPTSALRSYADFLAEVKKALPPGTKLSITALLDWFRSGTAVGDTVKQVDEFVPQFYDVQDSYPGESAIATRFEAAKWNPIFNRFKTRFRIGISTFGRSRLVPAGQGRPTTIIGNLKPLDIAMDSAFRLETSRTAANEIMLNYRATRKTSVGYNAVDNGDAFQFVVSTPDAIGSAVKEAKLMRGYCAGVIFFRWPAFNETLAPLPGEVLSAAGVIPAPQQSVELHTNPADCAAVKCMDLYLVNTSPLTSQPVRYGISSSVELEYFLPAEKMPIRMSGPSLLELTLPPYCGRSRIYLGRAVTAKPSEFTIGKAP